MISQKPTRRHGQTLGLVCGKARAENSFPLDVLKNFDCLDEIFSETSISYLTRIAENLSVPASLLEQLSLHHSAVVREAVADNPNTPLDILWLLANDQSPDVRYAIAENHNIDLDILEALSEDENPYVACRAESTIQRLRQCSVFDRGYWQSHDRAVG